MTLAAQNMWRVPWQISTWLPFCGPRRVGADAKTPQSETLCGGAQRAVTRAPVTMARGAPVSGTPVNGVLTPLDRYDR